MFSLIIYIVGFVIGSALVARRLRNFEHCLTFLVVVFLPNAIRGESPANPFSSIVLSAAMSPAQSLVLSIGGIIVAVIVTEATWYIWVAIRWLYYLIPPVNRGERRRVRSNSDDE